MFFIHLCGVTTAPAPVTIQNSAAAVWDKVHNTYCSAQDQSHLLVRTLSADCGSCSAVLQASCRDKRTSTLSCVSVCVCDVTCTSRMCEDKLLYLTPSALLHSDALSAFQRETCNAVKRKLSSQAVKWKWSISEFIVFLKWSCQHRDVQLQIRVHLNSR